jgi:CRISPR-associated protein Cas2
MRVIVVYDISDNRRRGRIHKYLKTLGVNSQKSVFECDVSRDQLNEIRDVVESELDPSHDGLRIYKLCRHCYGQSIAQGNGVKIMPMKYQVI